MAQPATPNRRETGEQGSSHSANFDHRRRPEALRLNKVINEPDFLPLHVVRQLAQAATLVRAQRGKLMATPLGKSMLSEAQHGSLLAILFHLAFWHMDLGYFGRGLLGSWPQADAGVVLWSLSACAGDWQSAEKLTRLCTIPEPAMLITKMMSRMVPSDIALSHRL